MGKFNFNKSKAAQEISEEMSSVGNAPINPGGSYQIKATEETAEHEFGKRRTPRTKTDDWTLVQCRLPKDLCKRMNQYNVDHDCTKNDFIIEAVRLLLEKVGG